MRQAQFFFCFQPCHTGPYTGGTSALSWQMRARLCLVYSGYPSVFFKDVFGRFAMWNWLHDECGAFIKVDTGDQRLHTTLLRESVKRVSPPPIILFNETTTPV